MARELQSSSALAELSYLPPQTPSSKPAYPHSPNTPAANLRDFQGSLPQLSTLPQERRASARRGCSANATATPIPHTFGRHSTRAETRAAGVSPPWLGRTIGAAVRSECCSVRRANTQPRAAGVSPPWVSGIALATKSDFVDERRSSSSRAAWRQPAVGVKNVLAGRFRKVAGDCRRCAHETPVQSRQRTHGGLTPPALCCIANVCRRKIFAMHERTSSQERRASARRG
jgi:hypothetical protein